MDIEFSIVDIEFSMCIFSFQSGYFLQSDFLERIKKLFKIVKNLKKIQTEFSLDVSNHKIDSFTSLTNNFSLKNQSENSTQFNFQLIF